LTIPSRTFPAPAALGLGEDTLLGGDGAGQHDREIDELLRALDALPGPVWLTLHHEPEGGAGSNTPVALK
jgi:hypothetical protein